MIKKNTINELKHLMKHENKFYKDKETQMVDYQKKAVTIVGGSEDNEFLMALMYELYSGQLYGDRSLVKVYLFDSKSNLEKAEFAYASIWISDFILTSDPKRALKKSEYVIIHPNVKWDKDITREQIIKDHFEFFRTLAEQIIEYCIPSVQVLLIGARCLIPFHLILTLFLNKLPMSQLHAVTRTIERSAASLISHKIQCNSNEVRGVAVFGEDIVEVENAWLEWSPDCDADLIDHTTIKYGNPELGQWVEKREELLEALNRLKLPKGVEVVGFDPLSPALDEGLDLPPLVVPHVDLDEVLNDPKLVEKCFPSRKGVEGELEELEAELKSHQWKEQVTPEETEDKANDEVAPEQSSEEQVTPTEETEDKVDDEVAPEQSDHGRKDQESETVDWEEWMKKRCPETNPMFKPKRTFLDDYYEKKRTSATQFRENSRPWQCPLHPVPLEVPPDSKHQGPIPKFCSNWRQRITTAIKDENFLKGTIFQKCRYSLTGFAQAKGVINYIRKVLLVKKTIYTNKVVCSPGIYGIPEGFYSSFPVHIDTKGRCKIIQGYLLSEITLMRIQRMVKEVLKDYEQVFELFYYNPPQEIIEQPSQPIYEQEYEQLPEEAMEGISELQDEVEEEIQDY